MTASSTTSGRRRQEDRTALSDRLLKEAAVALLNERGLTGTTLAAIGQRAGYSRGLVTHRFGTKAGLFAYVHDTVAAAWIARVQSAVGESVGVAALHRAIEALHGFIRDEPDDVRAMYLLRYASIDPGAEYRANVAKVHRAQHRDVQAWIERGQVGTGAGIDGSIDANIAAELFCAVIDGLLYRWLVTPTISIDVLHERLHDVVQQVLTGAPAFAS
ncbi:TetR family transcriptional regulator [Steroidobacter denitrificans]|uniref:TetR family transcriptional regulator n=1 Tax=Steroidobacter denitrificans TaxID=465721 RepID=A0A127F804_STEDE|nr:TetR/AcrR family transcriptional regulator [Steroidobacter denitrificans]AMN45761.1 TetR family transcriptional regulator [Steroidobacter denitrificans]